MRRSKAANREKFLERQNRWYAANKSRIHPKRKLFRQTPRFKAWRAARFQNLYAANRAYWIEKLGGQCADCGNTDIRVIDFDHIDPATKMINVSSLFGRFANPEHKKISDEASKCEIRCANCHRIRTFEFGRRRAAA